MSYRVQEWVRGGTYKGSMAPSGWRPSSAEHKRCILGAITNVKTIRQVQSQHSQFPKATVLKQKIKWVSHRKHQPEEVTYPNQDYSHQPLVVTSDPGMVAQPITGAYQPVHRYERGHSTQFLMLKIHMLHQFKLPLILPSLRLLFQRINFSVGFQLLLWVLFSTANLEHLHKEKHGDI